MPRRYQDIYPEKPLLQSADLQKQSARDLLALEFFEAEPAEMPSDVYSQHHIVINLRETPQRIENWRDADHRDFMYYRHEIVVTPAGIRSGWKWYEKTKCIIITLEPEKFEQFAQKELGILLGEKQLKNMPQFIDEDITQAAIMLMEALKSDIGSDVMFESFARIFLTKLIQKYGVSQEAELAFQKGFTAKHYKRVLTYVSQHYGQEMTIDKLAAIAGLSTAHFSRLFKQTIGQTPHQFVMSYRIEQAKKSLIDIDYPLIDIALSCGFADQAHFSRVFKQIAGVTPRHWRLAQSE